MDDLFQGTGIPSMIIRGSYLASDVFNAIFLPRLKSKNPEACLFFSETSEGALAEAPNAALKIIYTSNVLECVDGYTTNKITDAISAYIENKSGVDIKIWIPREKNKADPPIIWIDAYACGGDIVKAMPVAFCQLLEEHPLTEEEEKAFASYSEHNDSSGLLAIVQRVVNALYEDKAEDIFINMANGAVKEQISSLKNSLKQNTDIYNNYLKRLYEIANKMQVTRTTLSALESAPDRTKMYKEIFSSVTNMGIKIRPNGNDYSIYCRTWLTNYDADIAETYILGKRSSYFTNSPDFKMLFEKIFLNPKHEYKVRIFQPYKWNKVDGVNRDATALLYDEVEKAIQNPHLFHYDCMGSGRDAILAEAIANSNWEGFFGEISAISSCISWGDISAQRLIIDMQGELYGKKFIEDRSGNIWSPRELIAKLTETKGE